MSTEIGTFTEAQKISLTQFAAEALSGKLEGVGMDPIHTFDKDGQKQLVGVVLVEGENTYHITRHFMVIINNETGDKDILDFRSRLPFFPERIFSVGV